MFNSNYLHSAGYDHFLCVLHKPPNNTVIQVLLLFTFHKWRNWDLKRWTKLLSHTTSILQTHTIINSLVLYFLLFKTMSVVLSFNIYMNHFKSLLKHSFLGPMLRNSEIQGGAHEFLFLTNSRMMLMLLVQVPHFENHWTNHLVLLGGYWKILGHKPK